MSTLTVKAVYSADTGQLVGASNQATAALDKTKAAAQAGAQAQQGLAGGANQTTAALERERTAADQAAAAIGANRSSAVAHIDTLKAQAASAAGVTEKVRALSAAHAAYNSTVNQSKQLLADNIITEAQHNAVLRGAAAELALVKAGASTSARELGNLNGILNLTGRYAGIGRAEITALRQGIMAIPAVIANYPLASTFLMAAAAIGILVAAEQSLESSELRVGVAAAAHLQTVTASTEAYARLAIQMAATGDIASRQARSFEALLLENDVNPQAWTAMAEAVRGFAVAHHKSIEEAQADLAGYAAKPGEAARQLGFLGIAAIGQIETFERLGQKEYAQVLLSGELANHYRALGDETNTVAKYLENARTNALDLWDAIGRGAHVKLPDWWDRFVNTNTMAWTLFGNHAPAGDNSTQTSGSNLSVSRAMSARSVNDAGVWTAGELDRLDPYSKQLRENDLNRQRAQGLVDKGVDVDANKRLLNQYDVERTRILKLQRDAVLNLDDAEKQRQQQIRSLLQQGPQLVRQTQMEADFARQAADAVGLSATAQRELNNALEIQRATLPYVTALEHAHGDEAKQLKKIIDELTRGLKEKQAAEAVEAARTDILEGLRAMRSAYTAAAEDALKWKTDTTTALRDAGKLTDEAAADIERIFNKRMADAYAEDLQNRRDWAAGSARAMHELVNATGDWARTSEDVTKSLADEFEGFATGTKHSLTDLGDFIIQWAMKLLYQRFLANTVNQVIGGMVDLIGSVLGVGGASNLVASSMLSGAPAVMGQALVGVHHAGMNSGSFSSPRTTRLDNPALYINAPRYHAGYIPPLGPKETRGVFEIDETIRTAAQERDLQRQLARGASATMAALVVAPKLEVHVHEAPGTKTTTKQGQNADGSPRLDVIIEQIADRADAKIAEKHRQGRSLAGNAILESIQAQAVVR
ncbi:MAG: hypothetical protein WDN08_05280 [Rhizomicrobium sp.]